MATRPAAGRTRGSVQFFARSASHILVEEGTRPSFTLPSTSLFSSTSDINPKVAQQQQLSRHINSIRNLHSAFDISSRRSQQNIYIVLREQTTTPAASGMLLRGTPESLCGRYAAEPLQRRACCSAARLHHFAVATPMKLCRAKRVRPTAPRITLLFLRLQIPAAPSVFAPRPPASLCGFYAYDPPPC